MKEFTIPLGEQEFWLVVRALQKEADEKLAKVLNDEQKKRLKQMQSGGLGGSGGFLSIGGPPGGGSLFRAYRYSPDFSGLASKELTPGKTVEELQPKKKGVQKPK